MTVDSGRVTLEVYGALQPRAKAARHSLRGSILRYDAADDGAPAELAVGEAARPARGFRRVAPPPRAGCEAPHHLGLGPALGVPQPAIADPLPGRFLLQRPRPVTT